MLDADELACAREGMSVLFDTLCVVQQMAAVSDGQGGWTETYTDVAQPITATRAGKLYGNLRPYKFNFYDRMIAAQNRPESEWLLKLPTSTVVNDQNTILINGKRYQVVNTDADHTDALCLTARLRLV